MRILRPIVFSQALLMVAGTPKMLEGSATERSLSVVTLVGAKPCLRSSLRISLTAADRSRRRWTRISRTSPSWSTARHRYMLARDPDDHFVEMAAISRSRTAPSQAPSDRWSEFEHPTANALVGEVEATLGKQLLDIAIA